MAIARALTSFHALERFVADGDELDSSDPIVVRFPSLFDVPTPDPAPRKAAAAKKRTRKAHDA